MSNSSAAADPAEQTSPRPVDHVCFVVHGMGQQWEGMGRFHENLAQLRKTCKETIAEEFGKPALNIRWIGVEWHSVLHRLETVDKRMKTITLPTCSVLRNINNNILADVLYYFTSFHGQSLIKIVAAALNEAYDRFMGRHPDFRGKISLVCHSLGGIICYDILAHQADTPFDRLQKEAKPKKKKDRAGNRSHLSDGESPSVADPTPQHHGTSMPGDHPHDTHFPIVYPKLKFKPNFLFNMGSPLPAVLVMRGQSYHNYRIPKTTRFFNLFHLYDPMAYRIEPLIDPRYVEISPILIQRPSNGRTFQFSYYQELIRAYLPDLPSLPSFPTMPGAAALSSMRSINISGNLPSISLPNLPSVSLPNISFPLPVLPSIPTLSRARKSLQTHLGVIYDSVLSNWGSDTGSQEIARKRKRSPHDTTNDQHTSDTEAHSLRTDENSPHEGTRKRYGPNQRDDINDDDADDGEESSRVKRREIHRDDDGDIVWQGTNLSTNVNSEESLRRPRSRYKSSPAIERSTIDSFNSIREPLLDDTDIAFVPSQTSSSIFRLIRRPTSLMSGSRDHHNRGTSPETENTLFVPTPISSRTHRASSPIPISLSAAIEDFTGMIRRNFLSVSSSMASNSPSSRQFGSASNTLNIEQIVITDTSSSNADSNQNSNIENILNADDDESDNLGENGENKDSASLEDPFSSMTDLSNKLTAELVAAAKKAEEQIAMSLNEDDEEDAEVDANVDDNVKRAAAYADKNDDDQDSVPKTDQTDCVAESAAKADEKGRQDRDGAADSTSNGGKRKDNKSSAGNGSTSAKATNSQPSSSSKHVLSERLDYFVQETIIDNMVHQYLVGLKAHFSYWTSKDIMYHILCHLLDHKSSADQKPQESAEKNAS